MSNIASNHVLKGNRCAKLKKKQKARWTVAEHRVFLRALEANGPNFEAIADAIGNKSARDVHVHAFNFLNLT